jgi:hypothetical protein
MLATDISATDCLDGWVYGVASSGVFYKHHNISVGSGGIPIGDDGIPSNWNYFDYFNDYLAILSLEDDNTISFSGGILKYKINNGEWIETNYVNVKINKFDIIRFKGEIKWSSAGPYFRATKKFNVQGDIMSITRGTYGSTSSFNNDDIAFGYLFYNNQTLIESADMILPSTNMTYNNYAGMFKNCSSMINAPELPATTLSHACYSEMFYNCSSLTKAPELPATTLTDYCYQEMFVGCSNLSYIKMLAYQQSGVYCFSSWVSGVASSSTFVKRNGFSMYNGSSGIPNGWTVENV